MKKKKFIYLFVLLLSTIFLLFGCSKTGEIDRYYKKMQKAESATIVFEIQVPIFGKMAMDMKVDGNKTYTSEVFGNPEEYTETVDNVKYTYQKDMAGNWTKEKATFDEDDMTSDALFSEVFNPNNYKYSKDIKKFVLNEGANIELFNDMTSSSYTLEIDGDTCIIAGEMKEDGMVMSFTIIFKNLNKTKIILPEVA